jgi:hypothetical protein
MRWAWVVCWLGVLSVASAASSRAEPRLLQKVTPLPDAPDPAFQFRKIKIFFMSDKPATSASSGSKSSSGINKLGDQASRTAARSTTVVQDASISFERKYRLYGAVTKLDERQRYGDYFDFYWRVKRPANVTVRMEYRQEKLHEHVQAQEISYNEVRGTSKSEFKVVGDDYLDNGRVIAWRCLLVENGRVVAENRSYLWR